MSAAGIWPSLSDTPFDFADLPSSMGQGPGLGLGLALAQPERGVIVVNGDGCTLMNLGCLVTMAGQAANLFLLILDNALYEVTGGQPTAGAGHTDFAALRMERESNAFIPSTICKAGARAPPLPWKEMDRSWRGSKSKGATGNTAQSALADGRTTQSLPPALGVV